MDDTNRRAEDGDRSEDTLRNDPIVDGRIVMGRADDHTDDEPIESPEHDAEVQAQERGER